mgnify:FL=1
MMIISIFGGCLLETLGWAMRHHYTKSTKSIRDGQTHYIICYNEFAGISKVWLRYIVCKGSNPLFVLAGNVSLLSYNVGLLVMAH